MKHFTPADINEVLSQLVCSHPECLQVLSRKNTSGLCPSHKRTREPGDQVPRGGNNVVQFAIPVETYKELNWLATRDGCTLAAKLREMLEWGLRTLDEDERMPK